MIMRMSWKSLLASAALLLVVLLMATQFAPAVLGAAMAMTDLG
jgi:hypothetical protein